MFKRKLSLLLAVALVSASMSTGVFAKSDTNKIKVTTHAKHSMGCIPASKEKVTTFKKGSDLLLDSLYSSTIPSSKDLSSYFPEPGNQGQQNSCTAWATTYADKTALTKMSLKWNVSTLNHQFSPAYVYNQINGGVDEGAQISDALDVLVKQGVCTLQDMPYDETDYFTQPNAAQKKAASSYKSNSWYVVNGINNIKASIANNKPVVIGTPVYEELDDLSTDDPVYDTAQGKIEGYHAICLLGYDDSIQCDDGSVGAFKFINSWGSDWGVDGYGYMSYKLVNQFNLEGYVLTNK